MSELDTNLLSELQARGLVAQVTGDDQLADWLRESRTLYCGFDPTADSLHIGSLVPLLTLKRFQQAGHRPIALVGGATGMIGDPSGKSQERNLNTDDVVKAWVQKIRDQLSQFIDFDCGENAAVVANNLDWIGGMDVLTFLRDVGKHFSVNSMVKKDSVKQRIDREGEGISYTEFTYMILQSLDFAELYRSHNCTLQIGGSDQWGNITEGVDLTRRLHGKQVFGLTMPLVTKSDGSKFGKTESGTIWLDANRTSPYAFYQFWLNTTDADVYKFLRYFTFLSVEKIVEIEEQDKAAEGRPGAQLILATEMTRLVHGSEGLDAAERITEVLFSGSIDKLGEGDLKQLQQDGLPSSRIGRAQLNDQSVSQWLVEAGMVTSGKQIKDALQRKALLINGAALEGDSATNAEAAFAESGALFGVFYLVKLGKKKYHLFEVS